MAIMITLDFAILFFYLMFQFGCVAKRLNEIEDILLPEEDEDGK